MGIEPMNNGFADRRVTTSPLRRPGQRADYQKKLTAASPSGAPVVPSPSPGGGTVDVGDLKSLGPHGPCEFESHPGHTKKATRRRRAFFVCPGATCRCTSRVRLESRSVAERRARPRGGAATEEADGPRRVVAELTPGTGSNQQTPVLNFRGCPYSSVGRAIAS